MDSGTGYECLCPVNFPGPNCDGAPAPPQPTPKYRGKTFSCATNDPCNPDAVAKGQYIFKCPDPSYYIQCSDSGVCSEIEIPAGADDEMDEEINYYWKEQLKIDYFSL